VGWCLQSLLLVPRPFEALVSKLREASYTLNLLSDEDTLVLAPGAGSPPLVLLNPLVVAARITIRAAAPSPATSNRKLLRATPQLLQLWCSATAPTAFIIK
jgi:hypothetical protein